jgi:hypothetical protein
MRPIKRRYTVARLVSASTLNTFRGAIIIALLLKARRNAQVENNACQLSPRQRRETEAPILETLTRSFCGIKAYAQFAEV